MHPILQRRVLLALLACDGLPLPHDTLVDAVTINFVPRPTRGDVESAIKSCEASGFIAGATVELEGIQWGLTGKGTLKARQLQ